MAVYKFVSSQAVISKVYRDLDIRDANWELSAVEWVGDLLRQIGAHQFQLPGQANVAVSSFKAAYPDYMTRLDEVWKIEDNGIGARLSHSEDDFQQEVVGIEEGSRRYAYRIEPTCLAFTFEEGSVLLKYRIQCVDDKGYPLVPDNQNFEEAALYYFMFKMSLRGWIHPNPKIDVHFIRAEYLRYVRQARDTITYPTPDQMDDLVINWTGISPNETDYSLYAMRTTPAFPATGGGPVYGTSEYNSLTTPEYNLVLQRAIAEEQQADEMAIQSDCCVDDTTPLVPTISQPEAVGIQFLFINPPVKVEQCGTDGIVFDVGYRSTKALVIGDVILASFPASAVATLVSGSIRITAPYFTTGPHSATVTVFGITQNITIESS